MRTGKTVLMVWIEKELMDKINNYQHFNKHQFRSDAVKSLLRYALEMENREEVNREKITMAE